MLVISSFGAIGGWLVLVSLGLEGLGVFCVSCFGFFFCLGFVFVYFALFLLCCWIFLGVLLVFVLGGLFCFFFFLVLVLFVLVYSVCLCWDGFIVFVFSCCVFWFVFVLLFVFCWSGLGVVLVFILFGLGVCLCLFAVCLLFVCCLFVVCLCVCVCLFLSVAYQIHCFPCNSSTFGLMFIQSLFLISVAGSCFLFLFCLLLFQDVPLFVFLCLLSCFDLNHNVRSSFALHILFLLLFFFALAFCFWLPIKKHLSKVQKFRKPQKRKMQKK